MEIVNGKFIKLIEFLFCELLMIYLSGKGRKKQWLHIIFKSENKRERLSSWFVSSQCVGENERFSFFSYSLVELNDDPHVFVYTSMPRTEAKNHKTFSRASV